MPILQIKNLRGKIINKNDFGIIFNNFLERPLVGDTIVNNKNEKFDIVSIEVKEEPIKQMPIYTYNIKKKRKTKEA
jgi:hypothetical protein